MQRESLRSTGFVATVPSCCACCLVKTPCHWGSHVCPKGQCALYSQAEGQMPGTEQTSLSPARGDRRFGERHLMPRHVGRALP